MYSKQDWVTGETITEAKLDHMEQGIYDASDVSSVITAGSVKPVNSVAVLAYIASLDANNTLY